MAGVKKAKRGRPRLSEADRVIARDRAFLLELARQRSEEAKAQAAAISGLTRALETWFEMFKVSATPPQGWTNTDATEYVREKAQELGIAHELDPRLAEIDQIRWLEAQMDAELKETHG